MSLETSRQILDRIYGDDPRNVLPSEAPVLKELRMALAAHRGACHALEHMASTFQLDKQRVLDEIEYLKGRLESLDIDIKRTQSHAAGWEEYFMKTYTEITQKAETTPSE